MTDELRALYQETILDHSRSPRNLRHPEAPTHTAEGHNPMCGDTLDVFLSVNAAGVVEDAAFEGRGCAISLASASLMTEMLRGRSVDEAGHMFEAFRAFCDPTFDAPTPSAEPEGDLLGPLRVFTGVRAFPVRAKCATLPWYTMRAALAGEPEATSE